MLELSKKVVAEEIEKLYSGSNPLTDFNNELYIQAYNEVKFNSVERIANLLLENATDQLDESDEGNFLWKMIYNGINAQVEMEVHEVITDYAYKN